MWPRLSSVSGLLPLQIVITSWRSDPKMQGQRLFMVAGAEGINGSILTRWFLGSWSIISAWLDCASSLPSPNNLPPPHPPSKLDFLFNLARDGFCYLQQRAQTGIEVWGQKGEFYQWFPRMGTDKRNVGRPGKTDTPFRFGGWTVGREYI